MPTSNQISQSIRGQTPDVLQWKGTLRSPSPKTIKIKSPARSASPARSSGTYSTDVQNGLRRSNSSGNLRKSLNMSGSGGKLNKSQDLTNIEGEYIKNLQKQIYFLELESNHLREQARKATNMHPVMTSEAERMLNKLRRMQAEIDGLQLEVNRRESNMDLINTEKSRITEKLQSDTTTFNRERRLLSEEIIQVKKNNNALERECAKKDATISLQRDELEKNSTCIRSQEERISLLRNQLDQRIDQHKLTQLALEEKRAELLRVETQLREIEEKYYNSSVTIAEKATKDLREEVRMLRQKVKETEMSADQDRYLRNKLTDDSSHLVTENALLNQQVIELHRNAERERELREGQESRRSTDISGLLHAKEDAKKLQFEVNQLMAELKRERDLSSSYREQLSKQDEITTSTQFNASTTQSRLAEVEMLHNNTESENTSLRRDKMLLVDHVTDLQRQLREKENEEIRLRALCGSVSSRVDQLDRLKSVENIRQSQKWEEFEHLADTLKSLSHSMALASSPRQVKYQEY